MWFNYREGIDHISRIGRFFLFDNVLETLLSSNGKMDAIRKKMKSIKDETDQLYAIISKFENATNEAESISKEVSSI